MQPSQEYFQQLYIMVTVFAIGFMLKVKAVHPSVCSIVVSYELVPGLFTGS